MTSRERLNELSRPAHSRAGSNAAVFKDAWVHTTPAAEVLKLISTNLELDQRVIARQGPDLDRLILRAPAAVALGAGMIDRGDRAVLGKHPLMTAGQLAGVQHPGHAVASQAGSDPQRDREVGLAGSGRAEAARFPARKTLEEFDFALRRSRPLLRLPLRVGRAQEQ
jgi:hypothetical protein